MPDKLQKLKGKQRFGSDNPFFGRKHSIATIEKLRLANRGRKHTDAWKKKMSELNMGNKRALGYRHTPEAKEKIRITSIRKHKPMSEAARQNLSKLRKGRKQSKETVEKRRQGIIKSYRSGNHRNWKGGSTPLNQKIRTSLEYKIWRESVFERDDYTCIWCGIRGSKLNADHIKPFAYFPELRFAIDNGRTLCIDCHKTTDTYGSGAKKLYGNKQI